MTIATRLHSKPGSFFGRLLTIGFSVWLLGVAFSPALAAVTVDQAPLIIQKSLPPNITLMLDDSGSMASDYMPDKGYLVDTSNDGYRNSANNGTYYNPTITYVPPPKADGTSYPASPSLTGAFKDGFLDSSAVDITQYKGSYKYYTSFTFTTTNTYASTMGCASGDTLISSGTNSGQCQNITYTCTAYDWWGGCQTWASTTTYYAPNVPTCNGIDSYDATTQLCTATTISTRNFFTYTTGAAAGPYTQHYVGSAADCAALPTTSQAVCDSSAVTQQNVANWFSYYRTRMLMAKSGVMNAFSTIDSTYRVGFGSIDGANVDALGSDYFPFTTTIPWNGGTISYPTGLAVVKPFGSGAASTQKANLWNWMANEKPNGGTPLRMALDFVGKYYETAQPWQSPDPSDSTATVQLACRQSYTILTTDGFWNGTDLGNGNIDNTSGPTNAGLNGQSYSYTAASPYKDSTSDTLADVAMKYWKTDLMSSTTGTSNIANEVPISTDDPAFWQHMTTFTLGLGFTPQGISPTGTTIDQIFSWAHGGAAITGFSWPTPSSDSINNIADLAHAAVNGHGGFYAATSPEAFAAGLKDALKRASERVGTGASLAANSTQLKSGAFAYQANYYTAKWKGDLKAIAVDPNTGALATTLTWSAADPKVMPTYDLRDIHTYNPGVGDVAFKDPTKLSSAEQTALGSTSTDQQDMINYLRGDASKEKPKTNGIYRTRDTPLGDIIDSQPVYVGAPDANQFIGQTFTGSDTFASYAATTRQGLIFVAANDGMLHAFNADTGAEVYAYLPAAVITTGGITGGLATLSNPDYGATTAVPHQYFNDGELTVADVYFGSAWHSVAVGTTGRGLAKAVYALDVTDPAAIKLLWERSAGDNGTNADYIGQMIGKPVIAQTGVTTANPGGWSVLIGNGYNSKNDTAALLQFAIADGNLTVHTTDTTTGNGLAAPAVWIGDITNGISTMAYAGDAKGRVWSFVLNQIVVTGNGSKAVSTPTATPGSAGTSLYVAKDSGGTAQPITAGMLVGKNPITHDLWVFFGTGQYLNSADLKTKTAQSWYGLIVQSDTSGLAVDGTKTRSNLVQRNIIAETPGTAAVVADPTATPPVLAAPAIAPARAVTATPTTSDMTNKSGWYMDLLSPTSTTASDGTVSYAYDAANEIAEGERIVTPNLFQGNQLLATTRIPTAVDLCNPSGRGWIMAVDPFTGTSPSSSFFDLNGDGLINQPSDYIMVNGKAVATSGMGFSSLPNNPIFMGGSMLVSFDNGSASSVKTSGTSNTLQRVSWRELINQ